MAGRLLSTSRLRKPAALLLCCSGRLRLTGPGYTLLRVGASVRNVLFLLAVSRVIARAKAAVKTVGGSMRKVYYNKLGSRALLKPEWFEKKSKLLMRAARPPPKQKDKVDSIGRLPDPRKPIPFATEEEATMDA